MSEETFMTGTREAGPLPGVAPAPALPMPPKYRTWMLAAKTPFLFQPERESYVASIFRGGRYALPSIQKAPHLRVRRVLDIGAGEGAFACWAYAQWPGCWVDLIEYDEERASLARHNMPPGARILPGGDLNPNAYDVVRIATWFELGSPIAFLGTLQEAPMLILDVVEAPTDEQREAHDQAKRALAIKAWEAKVAEARRSTATLSTADHT